MEGEKKVRFRSITKEAFLKNLVRLDRPKQPNPYITLKCGYTPYQIEMIQAVVAGLTDEEINWAISRRYPPRSIEAFQRGDWPYEGLTKQAIRRYRKMADQLISKVSK